MLSQVKLPLTAEHEILYAFKQAHRRDDDIAIVNAAIRLNFTPPASDADSWNIAEASVVYGGVAPTVVICNATNDILKQQPLSSATLQVCSRKLTHDMFWKCIHMDSSCMDTACILLLLAV